MVWQKETGAGTLGSCLRPLQWKSLSELALHTHDSLSFSVGPRGVFFPLSVPQ